MSYLTCDVEVVDVSMDEAASMFDEVVRAEMGISGDEFLRRWNAGEWQDQDLDEVPGLVSVWMYLPFVQ